MSQHVSILLLGSNLGNKKQNIELALLKLQKTGCEILKKTDIITSSPVEFVSSNNFCNIAISISMHFSPIKLLHLIKEIERDMGRLIDSKSLGEYSDRLIDIDIVSYDCIKFITKKLQIPHLKHIREREFSKKLLVKLEYFNEKI